MSQGFNQRFSELPWRGAGRLVLAVIAATFVLTVAVGGDATVPVGGDYPAFHGAGTLALDGDWDRLYSPDAQAEAQAELWPAASAGSYLYFAYPPFVAALYAPLAALPYRLGVSIHAGAMAAAVVAALALLRPLSSTLTRQFELSTVAALLFFPVMQAITGGQNTPLALLLIAAVWRALHHIESTAESATESTAESATESATESGTAPSVPLVCAITAGVAIGLLAYKPQLAVPLFGVVLLAGHRRVIAAALTTIAGLWTFGAIMIRPGWVATWFDEASAFAEIDADVNGHNAVSLLGLAEAVFGAGSLTARAVAGPLVAVIVVGLMWLWVQRPLPPLDVRMAVTAVGLLMISPHAMYYDAGLLVLSALVLIDRRVVAPTLIAGLWALAWLQVAGESIGLAPTFIVVATVGAAATVALPIVDRRLAG